MSELVDLGVLLTIGITAGFAAVVVIGVFVLRRIIARRNPEINGS